MYRQNYIDETHRLALEAAMKGRPHVVQGLLIKLYKHALEAATALPSKENGFFHSRIEAADYVVGTCTDARSGVYVQLVKQKTSPHLLLTLGQKFAMENVDTARGNINTLFWQP